MGWSFGSFVTQSHMVRHGTASAYVLMGTIAEPGRSRTSASGSPPSSPNGCESR